MQNFLTLRRQIIKTRFSSLNEMQFTAAAKTQGPLLILAGAGSGKTTVLVNRIACLLSYGDAYFSNEIPQNVTDSDLSLMQDYLQSLQAGNNPVVDEYLWDLLSVRPAKPWEILAITFTNKAAGELTERIARKVGEDLGKGISSATFHSLCAKLLRINAEKIGFTSRYNIYDADDSKRLIKQCMAELNIDDKIISHKYFAAVISSCKDKLISPKDFTQNANLADPKEKAATEIYRIYQNRLISSNSMDFDDLLANTVKLFKEHKDVLAHYQNRYKYIMVDEYQDTNKAQYELIRLLAEKYQNICVVGDDDQSIYTFRGATIDNILSFEKNYPKAEAIKLEQNYRSTQNILELAHSVIKNNTKRKAKKLFTNGEKGSSINLVTLESELEEGKFIAKQIEDCVVAGGKYADTAILYRMNAQSNAIENVLMRNGIPYKIIGGFRFYERREIKDVLAYLQVLVNPNDDVRLSRIINLPRRGIGNTTIENAINLAHAENKSLFEIIRNANSYPELSRAAVKLTAFADLILEMAEDSRFNSIAETYDLVLEKSGLQEMLRTNAKTDEKERDRLENVYELRTNMFQYEQENENASLEAFLTEIALISDIDSHDENADNVLLLTIHSAKGLEFKNVIIAGVEDNIFPLQRAIAEGEIEEERRLMYVAITRAKQNLTITKTASRMMFGKTGRNLPSRFLNEMPKNLLAEKDLSAQIRTDWRKQAAGAAAPNPFRSPLAPVSKVGSAQPVQKYTAGEKVSHKIFGNGVIVSVVEMSSDQLLEVRFDKTGIKKLMAKFAPLQKI